MDDDISRRRFLKSTSALTGASLLRIGAPALAAITQAACTAREEAAAFTTLTMDEAADLAAIAARLIPTTDTPGATEAGVIYFFDRAWGDELSSFLGPARGFLQTINDKHGVRFATLSEAEQDKILKANEKDPRFELLRISTIFGFFAMAKHGGNKNHLGWDLLGFEGHHGAWESPFGYYDAEYAKEQQNSE
jgi:gluconate 2-dehydrogenase gamma chain